MVGYQDLKKRLEEYNEHTLGNEFKILPDKHQYPNELKIFFEQQDYAEIKHTMNWFIQEIGKHLK